MGIFKGLMGLFEAKPRSQDRIWKKDSERKNRGPRLADPVLRATPGPPPAAVETMRAALEEEKRPVPREESPRDEVVAVVPYPGDMEALMNDAGALSSDTARLQQMLGLQQQQMSPYWKQQYGQLGQGFRYPGQPLGDFWRPPGGGGK